MTFTDLKRKNSPNGAKFVASYSKTLKTVIAANHTLTKCLEKGLNEIQLKYIHILKNVRTTITFEAKLTTVKIVYSGPM